MNNESKKPQWISEVENVAKWLWNRRKWLLLELFVLVMLSFLVVLSVVIDGYKSRSIWQYILLAKNHISSSLVSYIVFIFVAVAELVHLFSRYENYSTTNYYEYYNNLYQKEKKSLENTVFNLKGEIVSIKDKHSKEITSYVSSMQRAQSQRDKYEDEYIEMKQTLNSEKEKRQKQFQSAQNSINDLKNKYRKLDDEMNVLARENANLRLELGKIEKEDRVMDDNTDNEQEELCLKRIE